jgi:hypothetical protein
VTKEKCHLSWDKFMVHDVNNPWVKAGVHHGSRSRTIEDGVFHGLIS